MPSYRAYAPAIVLLGLPLSALAQNILGLYGALHVTPLPPSYHGFPLHLLGYTDATRGVSRGLESAAAFAIAAAQSFMLWRLLAASDESLSNRVVAIGAALLAAIAVFSPLLTSSDPYFYVGAGILGFTTYDPPQAPFIGQFSPLNVHFSIDGTTYGPAWVALNSAIVALGHTFLQKLEALRIVNALAVISCFLLLKRCGVDRNVCCLFLLNPYIWYFFVATPHNDILALVAIVAAIAISARQPAIAVLLVTAAGLIKLPFLLVGSVAFSKLQGLKARCAAIAISVVACVAISWLIGGHGYVRSLLHYGEVRKALWDPSGACLIGMGSAFFVSLTLLAATRRKYIWSNALLAAAASPFPLAWYALWGLPYVLTERRHIGTLLTVFPIIGFGLDEWYTGEPFIFVILLLIAGFATRDYLGLVRLRNRSATMS